jgi:large subunit ribosomal protein L4
MKIDLYTQEGVKKGDIEISDKMFGIKNINNELINQALILQQANRRNSIAHTKRRDVVRGGGRKPHPQKHTGRARQGSIRSPHFKGGGVVFGPLSDRNFKKDMPRKQKRLALLHALSAKAKDNEIIALESYDAKEIKTAPIAKLFKKLPLNNKKTLIVIPEKNKIIQKSIKNIAGTKTILVNYLNIDDLLKFKNLLFFKKSLEKAEKIFLKD